MNENLVDDKTIIIKHMYTIGKRDNRIILRLEYVKVIIIRNIYAEFN